MLYLQVSGEQAIDLPYTYTTEYNPDYAAPVTVHISEYDGTVILETSDCPWRLEFVRGGFNSKARLAVGGRYQPDMNNGQSMDGICGNCDGNFDYRLCGEKRTDVSGDEDKYKKISESCAVGSGTAP